MPGEPRRELRRSRHARRPRNGSAERALPPGMARRLHADRAPRRVRVVRGVRDGRRFDGDAAREVAADLPDRVAVAAPRAVVQLPADLDLLAQRSQRLQPSGPRLYRHSPDQARNRLANLPAARRQLPAVGRRSLPAQPRLHQSDRDRQAAASGVARHRRGSRALFARRVRLASGPATTTARSRISCSHAPAT